MSEITLKAIEQLLDQKLTAAVAPLATKEDVHREVREGVECCRSSENVVF